MKINKYVFRDMIKDLDLGFTHLEIEEIILLGITKIHQIILLMIHNIFYLIFIKV